MGPFIDKPHMQEPAPPAPPNRWRTGVEHFDEVMRGFNRMIERERQRHSAYEVHDRRIFCSCGWSTRRLTLWRSSARLLDEWEEHLERVRV